MIKIIIFMVYTVDFLNAFFILTLEICARQSIVKTCATFLQKNKHVHVIGIMIYKCIQTFKDQWKIFLL